MKHLIIFLSLTFLMGCFTQKLTYHETYKDRYIAFFDEGEELTYSSYTTTKSTKPTGEHVFREFYPDSKTLIQYIEYKDSNYGIRHGIEKEWSDYGVLIAEGRNINGEKEGLHKTYSRKNGKLKTESLFKNGKETGVKKSYDTETGSLISEFTFVNGEREGEFFKYDEKGILKDQGEYRADTLYSSTAKVEPKIKNKGGNFKVVEKMPLFGDGCPELSAHKEKQKCSEDKMLRFIYTNLRYPADAREFGVQGMAIIQYVIEKDGTVSDVEVIRGLCDSIREEVQRVVSTMPTWTPGEQEGKKVKVKYMLPIRFKLEG